MTTTHWEDVDIPQGTFIGWGRVGQVVTGKVVTYSSDGALDFNGNPCPQLVLELTEPCQNFREKGTVEETLNAEELVTITAGQVTLKQMLVAVAADPRFKPGALVQIRFDSTHKSSQGNTVKDFKVRWAPGVDVPEPDPSDLL